MGFYVYLFENKVLPINVSLNSEHPDILSRLRNKAHNPV